MKKLLLSILIISLLLLPLTACSTGTENNPDQSPASGEELVVGMELLYPPFETTDENDNPDGFSVALANAIGEVLDRPVRIESMAWAGLIPAITTGKVDIVLSSMTITEERAETVSFSDPYAKSQLSLLISKDSSVQTFNDLKEDGKKLAVKRGTTGHLYAIDHLPEKNIIVFENAEAAVLEVSQGKSDAFIYDALTVYQNSIQYESTTRPSFEIFQESFEYWGIAMKLDQTDLLNDINSALAILQANGKIDEIADTYLGDVKAVFDEQNLSFFFDID